MLYDDDICEIYRKVNSQFQLAIKNLTKNELTKTAVNESALSDVIPGWRENDLDFGAYKNDWFAALFVDMRDSTGRANRYGAKYTFLTMYAYLPAMIEVANFYGGKVTDIAGDGLMVLWRNVYGAEHDAVMCGLDMLRVKDAVTNEILKQNKLKGIEIGVGVSSGEVVVTKIGFSKSVYDVKAFGDCINEASKLSNGYDEVHVSNSIKTEWPTSIYRGISLYQCDEYCVIKRQE